MAEWSMAVVLKTSRFSTEHSECARAHRMTIAAVVDHIVPVEHGGAMWDEGNHQALCAACHRRKTETEYQRLVRVDWFGAGARA